LWPGDNFLSVWICFPAGRLWHENLVFSCRATVNRKINISCRYEVIILAIRYRQEKGFTVDTPNFPDELWICLSRSTDSKQQTDTNIVKPTVKFVFTVELVLSEFYCRCTDRKINFLYFVSVFGIFCQLFIDRKFWVSSSDGIFRGGWDFQLYL